MTKDFIFGAVKKHWGILYGYKPYKIHWSWGFYSSPSTGFFINRTVFSIFLLFCLISSFELLKKFNLIKQNKKNINFFLKIYIRLFIIFITIGIITSFSRIGNFLLLITIVFYLLNDLIHNNKKTIKDH